MRGRRIEVGLGEELSTIQGQMRAIHRGGGGWGMVWAQEIGAGQRLEEHSGVQGSNFHIVF